MVVAVGVGVLVTALVAAVGPYRQTREFRDAVACHRDTGHCLRGEPGLIVGRRSYVTHSDDGPTTHYELTWQRADGSRQTRKVTSRFYNKTWEGQSVTLRLWDGEVVAIEVTGGVQWFLPKSGGMFGAWLFVAFCGLGVALWGLLFGWWDGLFWLCFRLFWWMLLSITPLSLVHFLAFGIEDGSELIVKAVGLLIYTLGIGWALYDSIVDP